MNLVGRSPCTTRFHFFVWFQASCRRHCRVSKSIGSFSDNNGWAWLVSTRKKRNGPHRHEIDHLTQTCATPPGAAWLFPGFACTTRRSSRPSSQSELHICRPRPYGRNSRKWCRVNPHFSISNNLAVLSSKPRLNPKTTFIDFSTQLMEAAGPMASWASPPAEPWQKTGKFSARGRNWVTRYLGFSLDSFNPVASIKDENRRLTITLTSMRVMECMVLVGVMNPLTLPWMLTNSLVNWYRNRRQNHEDELPYVVSYSPYFPTESILAFDPTPPSPICNPCMLTAYSNLPDTVIDVPYLFIQSLKDAFLPPSMSEGMERFLPQLRRREVNAGHFSHMLAPEVVNQHIREWLNEAVFPVENASVPSWNDDRDLLLAVCLWREN